MMNPAGGMEYEHDPYLFPLVREPASRWERSGLSPAQEQTFDRVATLLVALFVTGWLYTLFFVPRADLLADGPPVARLSTELTRNPLATDARPEPAFLVDAFVTGLAREVAQDVGGLSGSVRVAVLAPGDTVDLPGNADSLPAGAQVVLTPAEGESGVEQPASAAPGQPGIWNLALRMRNAIRPTGDVSFITLVPLSEKRAGRIGSYRIGSWPDEDGGLASKPRYRPPRGLVRVTEQNQDVWISEHVQLKDFLTKGQWDVWPKYVALDPRVLDKVELTIQELERRGHPVENIFVVSAFRTPNYNATGGSTAGRGALSRHMYGDAMDFCIDNDRDGMMDDLNGDGRVTVADARVIGEAAEAVERKYPNMVGGIGIYSPTGGHKGFVHLDTRGFRARW